MSEQWIPTRTIQRMENARNPRSVIGWEMRGGCYRQNRKVPGNVRLFLSGGGWLWYPENTPLDAAFADADDRGFDTSDARAKVDTWVKTGKGVMFSFHKEDSTNGDE